MRNKLITSKRVRKPSIVGKDEKFDSSKFWLLHGVDLEKRTISLYDGIDLDSASYVVRGLKKLVEVDPEASIDVEIASPGGCVYSTFAMYDSIIQCPCEVRTHAQGMCMSGGLILFLAGDKRYSSSLTTFMAHSACSRTWGKEFEQEIDVNELKRLNRIMYDLLEESSTKSATWWKKKLKHEDYYFDYDMALELEIITDEYEVES